MPDKPLEFKAELVDGVLVVKAIPERHANGNLTVHVPHPHLIEALIKEKRLQIDKEKHGVGHIQ